MDWLSSLFSSRKTDGRNFEVFIHEEDYKELCAHVLRKPHIETGGDLFGLWADEYKAVIQLALGPGENCRRTSASFYQDVRYLKNVGSYLTQHEGVCHIGEWHSHHQLGLARPSGGDENTVWNNMPTYKLSKFFIFIANIQASHKSYKVNVGCFLFEIDSQGDRLSVLEGEFKILHSENPFSLKTEVSVKSKKGAEKLRDDERNIENLELTEEEGSPCVTMRRRNFEVVIHEEDYKKLCAWVLEKPNIETSGDLFGLWVDENTATIQLVLGPGEGCRRTSTSFYQDVEYLEKVGSYLTQHEGVCHIGEWHSHHQLGLARPSGGEKNTVWNNMPTYKLSKFFIFIANIQASHKSYKVNVGCFLFEIDSQGDRLPVLEGEFKILHSENPFSLKTEVSVKSEKGVEKLRDDKRNIENLELTEEEGSPCVTMKRRNFEVVIHEEDYKKLCAWVLEKPNIETGGDLFGLWVDENTAAIQLVLGPGEGCRRTSTSFYQDVEYLEKVGSYLTQHEGVCHIGEWHSHHQLGLARPSGGDENTVWNNMPTYKLSKFVIFIANIEASHKSYKVNVGCFLFEINSKGHRLPVLQGEFKILHTENPLSGKREVCLKRNEGSEQPRGHERNIPTEKLKLTEADSPSVTMKLRNFEVVIYEEDYKKLCAWVLEKPNIETGGDLFGLWVDENTTAIQLVLGPGEGCRRTSTSFYQDVEYLEKVGSYLTQHEGVCHIGEWHSHHQLGLARPSGGDENTVWNNMPTYKLSKFVIFIANIETSYFGWSHKVNIGCFLFEIDSKGNRLPVLEGELRILHSENPLSRKTVVNEKRKQGAEELTGKRSNTSKGKEDYAQQPKKKRDEGHKSYTTPSRGPRKESDAKANRGSGSAGKMETSECQNRESGVRTRESHPHQGDPSGSKTAGGKDKEPHGATAVSPKVKKGSSGRADKTETPEPDSSSNDPNHPSEYYLHSRDPQDLETSGGKDQKPKDSTTSPPGAEDRKGKEERKDGQGDEERNGSTEDAKNCLEKLPNSEPEKGRSAERGGGPVGTDGGEKTDPDKKGESDGQLLDVKENQNDSGESETPDDDTRQQNLTTGAPTAGKSEKKAEGKEDKDAKNKEEEELEKKLIGEEMQKDKEGETQKHFKEKNKTGNLDYQENAHAANPRKEMEEDSKTDEPKKVRENVNKQPKVQEGTKSTTPREQAQQSKSTNAKAKPVPEKCGAHTSEEMSPKNAVEGVAKQVLSASKGKREDPKGRKVKKTT